MLPRPDPTSKSVTDSSRTDGMKFSHGKPGGSVSGIARSKSTITTKASGIPTVRSSDPIKAERKDIMPPPSTISRSQSLRRPAATQFNQDNALRMGPPRTPVSAQRPTLASLRLASETQVAANATPNGLARTASMRTLGSTSSSSTQPGSPRPLHSRAQSVNTTSKVETVEPPALARSGTIDSMHSRTKSSTGSIKGSRIAQLDQKPPTANGSGLPGLRSGLDLRNTTGETRARPAFNTLQQHYSPAKTTSKPPLPTTKSLFPSEGPLSGSSTVPFETSKMQSELLYLTLLHREAEPTLRSYQTSAHKALRRNFDAMQHDEEVWKQDELSYRETVNLQALIRWSESVGGVVSDGVQNLAQLIRALSSCIHELTGLASPDGRHADLVQEFTNWIEIAETIFTNQSSGTESSVSSFVNALSDEWHAAHTSVSQRLRHLEREVATLPPLPDESGSDASESSLASILLLLRSSTSGMRQELDLMLDLEQQVLAREKQRIEVEINKVRSDKITKLQPMQRAAWHT